MLRIMPTALFLLATPAVQANKIVTFATNHTKECHSMAKSIVKMNNLDNIAVSSHHKSDINHDMLVKNCLKSESSQKFASQFCSKRPGLNYCISSVNH